MRDFKVGNNLNVGGNLQINDNSNQSTNLIYRTTDELLEERIHRKKLLSGERKSKWKRMAIVWLFVGCVLGIVAIWFYYQGNSNLSSLFLGLGGFGTAFASVKVLEQPTEFEARQMTALNEIRFILRERGVE
jgi:hypothetical protein